MICIDCRYIRERPSGIGVTVQQIVTRVPRAMPGVRFLLLRHPAADRLSYEPNVTERVVGYEANGPVTMWCLPAAVNLRDVKVFHAPFNILPMGLRMKTVVTIHDVMWLTHPQWAQSPGVWGHVERAFYVHGTQRALRRATRICTVSEATRAEIRRIAPQAGARADVVLQAPSPEFRPPAQADEARIAALRKRIAPGAARYVLTVGQYAGYKNHVAVVRAFAKAFPDDPGMHLVLVQRLGAGAKVLLPLADRLGIRARVHLSPTLALDDLVTAYQGATCLCHPSLVEGFGFPLVEALASGCPVVTSNRSSMPEVCGAAGEYVDPEDADSIAAGLARVAGSPERADELRRLGLARARELTWERFAKGYEAVYRSLLEP